MMARMESFTAAKSCPRVRGSSLGMSSRADWTTTTRLSTTASRTPGPKPARKRSPMETPATTPKVIMGMDGGMTTPRVPPAAAMEAAKAGG